MKDNWGSRARIGIFIVGGEAVPEAEWWAMAPAGVSVHAARVTSATPWAAWRQGEQEVELAADIEKGITQLAALRVHAVVVAHTSSSIVGGAGWDRAVCRRLADRLGDGVAVGTNGQHCRMALDALAIRRPFLVLPPWFGDAMIPRAVDYFSGPKRTIAGHLRQAPPEPWKDTPPAALYGAFMHVAQSADDLSRQVATACPADADGVLLLGTGLRCVGIIAALEARLGRPVVTANQASLWAALRQLGIDTTIPGYGRLLAEK